MKKLFRILCLAFLQQQVDCEQLVNIALLKTPTQNGTLDYNGLWNVSNSVDGKTECTDVNYQTYSGTDVLNEPWWQLDLGSVYIVHAVHVMGRSAFPPRQLVGFRLQVGLEENSLSMVYRNNDTAYNNGDIWINITMNIRIIKIDLPNDAITGLQKNVLAPLMLCEVEVYALKCYRGRYGSNCNETCGHCVGGNQTCMHTDGTCPAGCDVGYDYAANRKCTTQCYPGRYGSNCNETCGHCVGGDQTCMHTDGTCPAGCAVGYNYAANMKCTTQCYRGRYGSNCNATCGYCVGGNLTCMHTDGTCPAGCVVGYDYAANRKCTTRVNILQQGPGVLSTSQSSQYAERNSSLAVDGRKGTDPEQCNCCSQTMNYELSWWQVDIGVTVPIREIVIHGRQDDDRYQQLSGFSVYLSTSGHFSDAPFMTVPRSGFNVTYHVDVDGRYARYVRIQRPGVLTICEVEVFQSDTSCLNNTFSLKCIPCGQCKGGLPCDVITGQCENGCNEGYTGELCTLLVKLKSNVGPLVGSALGGAAVVLVAVGIVALLGRKRRLSLEQSRSARDYDCPKWTSDANDQNMYDILDMSDPPISEQKISPSRNYVNTNDLKKTTF